MFFFAFRHYFCFGLFLLLSFTSQNVFASNQLMGNKLPKNVRIMGHWNPEPSNAHRQGAPSASLFTNDPIKYIITSVVVTLIASLVLEVIFLLFQHLNRYRKSLLRRRREKNQPRSKSKQVIYL